MIGSAANRVALAGVGREPSGEAMRSAVRAAVEAATDFSWLSKGDAVFIKPAANSGNPYPATTHPGAMAAMVELLREKGAGRVIVGDMAGIEHVKLSPDGVAGSTRHLMEASGMAGAVQAAGAELHFFEEAGWDAFHEEIPAAGSHWLRGLMMPDVLNQVDHIVLMPRCSRHAIAGCTLGLKAAVGYWRTDTRLEYHQYASTLHEKTAEANTVGVLLEKQRLVLTAADKILATFGPDDGHVAQPETGLIVASESVVAHDMVSLAWLAENRRGLSLLQRDLIRDRSRLFARFANRYIVDKLGGLGTALTSEGLTTKDGLDTIWADRMLNRAYEVLGGQPAVSLEAANGLVTDDLRERLGKMTTPLTA